jgi:tripartite-type tricarboxylate transporter receptor subunit TctC
MASQGYDVVLPISRGFVMPTGAPKEIVDILSAAFKKSLNSSEFKTKALEPNYLDPDQYATQWTEIEKQVGPLMDDIKAAQKTN